MNKIAITLIALATSTVSCFASDTLAVNKAHYIGPLTVNKPIVLDSATLDHKKFNAENIIDTKVSFEALKNVQEKAIADINAKKGTLNLLGTSFVNPSYTNVEVKVEGAKQSKVFIGDNEVGGSTPLAPGQYNVVIKYVSDSVAPTVKIISDKSIAIKAEGTKRSFTLDDNMEMKYYRSAALSPSGKYLAYSYSHFNNKGNSINEFKVIELATGRIVIHENRNYNWMPNEDKGYYVKDENGHKNLYTVDVATGKHECIARDLPEDNVTVAPNGEYLIYYIYNEGPKKQDGVYEVYTPDDRQPGYRARYSLGKYNIKTGIAEQLTYGRHNTYLLDISADSKYILFSVSSDSIRQRPSELQSIYRLNLETMALDNLVEKEGFVAETSFFPGTADKLIIKGTPEAFGGIGKNLPTDMTPSMYDYQLFAMDIPTKEVTPVTKYFDPSINDIHVSKADGMIYFTAENKDSVSLYRLNPKDLSIKEISQPTAVVGGITIAENAPLMVLYGACPLKTDCMYSLTLDKKQKVTLIEDLNKDRMEEIQLGSCHDLKFTCSRGYDVTGFYYLPANFDASKKYPMIVDYYGGCSPTLKRFGGGSHYPAHYWNSLGYIVLIVNPSGASGFGQEWAARHVNTAGEGVAEDIIEATEWLADHNTWVNKEKIGCVSASYGGFMTQTLLSKTDLYACGISHAGISSHTSYWGEGYWGHSYSEVSMANSYPWTRKDLYVDRSPIYNADKIHKPILFTHGTADTNVPIGESIQMYTAMKILGVPTAFVMVEGENHGIMDYAKRKKWINSMAAWFQRWLQDDSSWWYGMYPKVEEN